MEEKRVKKTTEFPGGTRPIHRKRIMNVLICGVLILAALVGRTAWHQIVRGDELSRKALEQQTSDNTVSAKRGKIYDRNYKVLASNVTVETISITPENVKKSLETNNIPISMAAEEIGNILSVDAKEIEN